MRGLPIRTSVSTAELRTLARRETRPRVALHLHAIADVLDNMSRPETARPCGMEPQALRDAVVRSNAKGGAGLVNPFPARPPAVADRG